jgi:saccharopine dehydrogenase-like NADP-dependent oxidoreductase
VSRVLVCGAYGVFGTHVSRELAARGVPLTLSGRDRARAERLASRLGPHCRAGSCDVSRPDSCRAALAGHAVAVNCAGPFQHLDATLLEACLKTGCHYVDITDDRAYAGLVRQYGERFRERGLAAIYGCSSLPGISGALALLARAGSTAPVGRARVTLFIGNRNPKGSAAVRSLLLGLGRPIAAPQGELRGFCDGEPVPLPPPFGRRRVYNFDSPDYDLLPGLLGTRSVSVKLGFELRAVTALFALLARLGTGYGPRTAYWLELPGKSLGWLGCSGAAIMAELFLADGSVRRAAISGQHDGQRMAALPCALVAQALSDGEARVRGAATAYEFLGAEALVTGLVRAGFHLGQRRKGAK